jgi:hypothetical protein
MDDVKLKCLKFHIEAGDYLRTLATILCLKAQEMDRMAKLSTENHKHFLEASRIMREIRDEVLWLSRHDYKVKK